MNKIFPFDKKLEYLNYDEFLKKNSSERDKTYSRNYELLKETTSVIDINDIRYMPNGRFSVYINEHEFECLYSDKKSDKLYIQLNGSREASEKLPVFKRWSFESIMDGNVLNIADPMYREFDSLHLGWYYGTKEESYCEYLVKIIKAVADFLNIGNDSIYFYASSGGGYAALYCCCLLPGSTCITINPQIDLNLYFYSTEFCKITGADLKEKDKFRRNELISLITEAADSRFIIVSNLRAYEDMTQLNALCRHIGCSFTNSLQRLAPNIVSWVYDAECRPFHGAQDYPEMYFAIKYLADIFDDIESYENLYRYFSELIHERYDLAEKLNVINKSKQTEMTEIFCSENLTEASADDIILITKSNISLECDRNFFNTNIFKNFEDDSIYNISITDTGSPDLSCDKYCLILRDDVTENIALKKVIPTGTPTSLFIKTRKSADRYSLRLYPDIPEENKGKKIMIDNISVRKIQEPFSIISRSADQKNNSAVKEPIIKNGPSKTDEKFSEKDYLYIRGYAVLPDNVKTDRINSSWNHIRIGDKRKYNVYYDPKNKVYCTSASKETWVFLLGSFMNTETGEVDIKVIAEQLNDCLTKSLDDFYDYTDILNGRYIIIFSKDGEENLITDATAMRSTYYCDKHFCIASHYNLINDIYPCEPHPFFKEYKEYFKKNISCVSLPGNITPYSNIKLLIPNHKLSLSDGCSIKRFFPRKMLEETTIEHICDYIADNIKRQYTNLVRHHDVIHSLTAGCDSRISLAAACDVKDKITLFTYHNSSPDMNNVEHADRERNYLLAKNIAEHEGMRHIEVLFQGPYPPDLMAIMNKNHYHPHNKLIMEMKKRYDFTPDTIHLRSSIIEILRNTTHILWPISQNKTLAEKFLDWAHYNDNNDSSEIKEHALPYFEEFVRECEIEDYMKYNYNSPDLIHYWENRLTTWLCASVLTDNDILCDTYMLFNTRKIIAYGFSLPTYWRNKNIIFNEILRRLWPSLLNYNMPNVVKQSYELVDTEFTGCLPMKKTTVKAGNLSDPYRAVSTYTEIRDFGACIGFSSTNLKKDDYISLETDYPIKKGISYYYEFDIFTAWQDYAPYGEVKYSVIIDNKPVYSAYCNDFNNRLNQIVVCFKASESRNQKITVRVTAAKDTSSNAYNGAVNIKSIVLKQEYVKTFDETPKIFCSRDRYLGL